MPGRIEDYAVIGDCETAALVSREGSIDWLCMPRFDSGACFAALLGGPEHGRWLLAPAEPVRRTTRRYREGTLILETEHETEGGAVTVIDCMPPRTRAPDILRLVVGARGQVRMRGELVIRFDYGQQVPWVRRLREQGALSAVAGPDALLLRTPAELRGEDFRTISEFTVSAGEHVPFTLTWHPSHLTPPPPQSDLEEAVAETERFWREWSARCTYQGEWRELVLRSLITLKALTYRPTGGIVAAATTSLPEQLGGVRNWDYRYCWLRDATFTLYSLLASGYHKEAEAWRRWLLRAAAGKPSQTQIMYGLAGERRLTEWQVPWLPGYEGAAPVRIGNAASDQFQLDVYGEVLDALHQARRAGIKETSEDWDLQRALVEYVERVWDQPDEGIWEVRGGRRHFTHSKVMAWVALDRAVHAVEHFGLPGPAERWRALRARIHAQVCERGFDRELGSFVQSYGARQLDASLLLIPIVGFLPAGDARVRGTVAAIERGLLQDGFVRRYAHDGENIDGLPGDEGAFLACSFWLADSYVLLGRHEEARRLFVRLAGLCNDVGLLSEEYDAKARRLVGNFPQAISHVSLVNTAQSLAHPGGPAEHRASAATNGSAGSAAQLARPASGRTPDAR